MRIAFFGSDAFAVPSLRALADAGHEIVLVVTNPDRRRGRSKTLLPTPVKELALELGAPVHQPEGRPRKETRLAVEAAGAELGVVVAYGQFLGKRLRECPSVGYMINLHGSLLPRWRGSAPVAAAILHGDSITGVSVQKVAQRMDAGDLLCSREEPIRLDDTRAGLRERLCQIGGELIVEAVAKIAQGDPEFTAQDESLVTEARMLGKDDGRVEFSASAADLDRTIRAYSPWPCAFVELEGAKLQLLAARPAAGSGAPGTVLSVAKAGGLTVATGEGALEILELKPAGKKAMTGQAYANGRRLKVGDALA